MIRFVLCLCFLIVSFSRDLVAQTLPAGYPVWEEAARKGQLLGTGYDKYSFSSRPLIIEKSFTDSLLYSIDSDSKDTVQTPSPKKIAEILPILSITNFNSNRPYGWGNYGMQNGTGFQTLVSPGAFIKFHFLEVQFRPEFVWGQNSAYSGFNDQFSDNSIFARFRYWNYGDNPERFDGNFNQFIAWGQSYASLSFGKAEVGISTQNLWWGPGQFTSLIFSNNSIGMEHLYLKTKSPANIGIGLLEAQMIFGKAVDSGLQPTQNSALNSQYFIPFRGDWRYINGLSLSYQPSFLKGLTLGFNRVFQQYSLGVEKTFEGLVPVFQGFQKEKFFENGNTVVFDGQAQDQILSVFFRFKNVKGKFEAYAEFGKNDHNLNWREFILNPEHARAYLFGFQKLFELPSDGKFIQVRGEVIQQKESVNRYIRYQELGVINTSWLTHYQARSFGNYGEVMGTGIGVGANAQILEASLVKGISKLGLLLQRIENHQDFYYLIQSEIPEQTPWVDFSAGLLWDFQWRNLTVSTINQLVSASNYQWMGNPSATVDFKGGNKKTSFSSSLRLIYSFR
jgi:hypothetical protein